MDRLTKEQMEWMNGYVPANIHDIYADGGIHIKPSHKGRFTAYKERTGKTTEEALHSKDPHVRQMANFARNAAHWKHQEGGTATGQGDEMTQLIQMYAQYVAQQSSQDPNQVYQQLMQQLQELEPEELQQAVEQMSSELQGSQSQEQVNPEEQMQAGGLVEYPIPNEDFRSGYQSYTMTPNPNAINIPTSGFATPTEGMDPRELIRNKRLMTETIADRKNWNRLAPERAAQDKRIQNFLDANPGSTTDDYFESTEYQNNVGTPGVGSTNREKLSGCAVNAPARAYGGELPHAQVGISDGFDFNDPYGLKQNRFGQTANYGDTEQYGANFNATPLVEALQPMSKPAVGVNIKSNFNIPSYQSKINPNTVNVNKKTMNNLSGEQIANTALFGLKAVDNWLTKNNTPDLTSNTMDNPFMSNPLNPYGNYTTNVQAGADFFQPGKHVAAQDYGSTRVAKYGGQQNFASGGQYKVSHEELLQLLRDGAEIEFL